MQTLTLPLCNEYFNQIQDGTKRVEYRLYNAFWRKRIEGKTFDTVTLMSGYPREDDTSRRIVRPWKGYTVKTITHPHFGNVPTKVFVIDLRG